MKFPGQRKSKHYFPVNTGDRFVSPAGSVNPAQPVLCGIDQTLVDIEAHVEDEFLLRFGLIKGESLLISDDTAEQIYTELKQQNLIVSEFAGGTVGNTLHNYAILSESQSLLFGTMCDQIKIGSYAYQYLCNTSSKVNLNYLQPVSGPIGRCFTFISKDGDRSFGINAGLMNQLRKDHLPVDQLQNSSGLLISAYLLRCSEEDPIKEATMHMIKQAKYLDIPIILTLGTRFIIEGNETWWQEFINEYVTVIAMNEDEGEALTGFSDPLLASDAALQWCDLVLCTAGAEGLYMAGYTDEKYKRETSSQLLPGAISEFNRYEYSRPMRLADSEQPVKMYSHIAPYLGGPMEIKNTNGAGDGALSAVLHDMLANTYHKDIVPNSDKHSTNFLAYSSLSQLCKYANRVSYEVLAQHSPRLLKGLPEREDSLDESYWSS